MFDKNFFKYTISLYIINLIIESLPCHIYFIGFNIPPYQPPTIILINSMMTLTLTNSYTYNFI